MISAAKLKETADAVNQEKEVKKITEYWDNEVVPQLTKAANEGKYSTKIKVPSDICFKTIEFKSTLHGFTVILGDPFSRMLHLDWRGKT